MKLPACKKTVISYITNLVPKSITKDHLHHWGLIAAHSYYIHTSRVIKLFAQLALNINNNNNNNISTADIEICKPARNSEAFTCNAALVCVIWE